jgi:hypothetical protein
MGDTIQPVEVGVAALIGRYADAVRIPANKVSAAVPARDER